MEVELPAEADAERIPELVRQVCRGRGLTMRIERPLAGAPKSKHWHFRKGREQGTLEVSCSKQGRRLWLSVHANRTGAWTTGEMARVKAALDAELKKSAGR